METVLLKPNDGVALKINKEAIMKCSKLFNDLLDDDDDNDNDDEIPLPNVSTKGLEYIIKFCEYHYDKEPFKIDKPLKNNDLSKIVSEWYIEFINSIDIPVLNQLTIEANYANVTDLYELCCIKIAIIIKTSTTEEVIQKFDIKDTNNEEEESKFKKDVEVESS